MFGKAAPRALRGDAVYLSARIRIAGAVIIAVLLCCVAVFMVVRGVSAPVLAMALAMQRLAEGDDGIEIAGRDRKDEIGRMASALEVFRLHEPSKKPPSGPRRKERAERQTCGCGEARRLGRHGGEDRNRNRHRAGSRSARAPRRWRRPPMRMQRSPSARSRRLGATRGVRCAAGIGQHTVPWRVPPDDFPRRSVAIGAGRCSALRRRGRSTPSRPPPRRDRPCEALNDQAGRRPRGGRHDRSRSPSKTNLLALNATIEAARAGGCRQRVRRWWPAKRRHWPREPPVPRRRSGATSMTVRRCHGSASARAPSAASAADHRRGATLIAGPHRGGGRREHAAVRIRDRSECGRHAAPAANEMTSQIGEASSEVGAREIGAPERRTPPRAVARCRREAARASCCATDQGGPFEAAR